MSLSARMFAWFLGLAVLLVAGTSAAYYLQTRHALLEALDEKLRERAETVAADPDADEVEERAAVLAKTSRGLFGFELYSLPGPALVARSSSLGGLSPPVSVQRLAALADARPHAKRTLAESVPLGAGGDVRVLAAAFPAARDGGSIVVVVQDLAEVDDELREVLGGFAVTLPIALVLAGLGAWLSSRHLTRPLREIAAAAARVESGGAEVAMPGSGAGDEIDRLAATLDRTFERLRVAYGRQARFSADAAHELRTPVSVVLSQAEVALRRERTAGEYREALTQIVGAARRMQHTLEALLLVARGDAGDLALRGGRVDLADVAREAIASCAGDAAAKSVGVHLDSPNPAVVAGDARLLAILVRNLVANAVTYSATGGSVQVTIMATEGGVVLAVRDEGIGIPPEALPRVFERFFRVDDSRSRSTGGSGLGLSLVRLIAEIHGGSASAESEPGRGTRITVRLPAPPLAS